jgi:hypothetical protein
MRGAAIHSVIPTTDSAIPVHSRVIPAQAGIQCSRIRAARILDARLRGDDETGVTP